MRRLRDWDTQRWQEEVLSKSTLKWYREGKPHIGYDKCYNKSKYSEYLAKARINAVQLEEHLERGKIDADITCKLCEQGDGDLEHFLVVCPELEGKRERSIMDKWKSQYKMQMTVNILFREENYGCVGRIIRRMCTHRKKLIKPP